jgi:hypothetical protein
MKYFYSFTLLLLSTFIDLQLKSQDTVRVNNQTYSNYEKLREAKSKLYIESSFEIWSRKNLKLYSVTLKDNKDRPISKAILFTSRVRDGQIHLFPDESIGYLDIDEVDSLVEALNLFLRSKPVKPSYVSKMLTYNSRGNVFAGCYINKKKWRVAITTYPEEWDSYTYLNEDLIRELITVLETVKGWNDEVSK